MAEYCRNVPDSQGAGRRARSQSEIVLVSAFMFLKQASGPLE